MNLHSIHWQLGDFVRYKPCFVPSGLLDWGNKKVRTE
jgi:hypothetical protein